MKATIISNPQETMKKINLLNPKYGVTIQVCNALRIATWEHIFFSALYAMLAFNQKRNISNQLALEILLYISGQRQIKIALKEFGIKTGNNIIIILGNSEELVKEALIPCEKILGGVKANEIMSIVENFKLLAIQNYFQINKAELNAIKLSVANESQENAIFKAVLNRIALVALDK
ncbi:MAG: KEOPS complex subunit Cgi121 [Promethearchaeota archaeon]